MFEASNQFLLFITSIAPWLLSILFLLYRLSSHFGFSAKTLKAPVFWLIFTIMYTSLQLFTDISDNFYYVFSWTSSIIILAIIASWVINERRLHNSIKKHPTTVDDKSIIRSIIRILSRVLFVVISVPASILVILYTWLIATDPIFDKFDNNKFKELDTSMQSLYQGLKTVSNGTDTWVYETECKNNNSGFFAPPDYNCLTRISMQKPVISVQELNDLHAKYYPIVNDYKALTPKTSLDLEFPGDFGKNFVISSANQNYNESKTGILCRYSTYLSQLRYYNDLSYEANYSYGAPIINGAGNVTISLECSDEARENWYSPSY